VARAGLVGQGRFQFGQRRTGRHGHHQFTGGVIQDAGVAPRVEQLRGLDGADKIFAAAATDLQRGAFGHGGADLVEQCLERGCGLHGADGKAPPRRCA
jgi:hypothetical protein